MNDKVFILIAGVNGAGKSTFYHSDYNIGDFFDFCDSNALQDLHRVNADEILREFGSWRDTNDSMKAGRIAVKKINDFLKEGASFCQETTLCGRGVIKNINKAKDLGYKVGIIYVGIDSPELAISRVEQRVQHGGHGVDENDIRRRFYESFDNLNTIIDKCDGVLFFDNTSAFRSVAVFNGKDLHLTNSMGQPPKWFTDHIALQPLEASVSLASNHDPFKKPKKDGR